MCYSVRFWLLLCTIVVYGSVTFNVASTMEQPCKPLNETKSNGTVHAVGLTGNYSCRCGWIKNSKVNLEIPYHVIFANATVDTNGTRPNNCSLRLFGIASEDNGEWRCEMTNWNAEDETQVRDTDVTSETKKLTRGNPENVVRSFTISPESTNVSIGSDAILRCELSAQAPWCFWSKDGAPMAIEGRYAFLGDKDEGNCTMKIRNVSMLDDGSWICRYPKTSLQPELTSAIAKVIIIVLSQTPVISTSGIGLKDGQKIYISDENINQQISCWSLDGNPASRLSWQLNSGTIVNTRTFSSNQFKLYSSFSDFSFRTLSHYANSQNRLTCTASQITVRVNSTYSETVNKSVSVELIFSKNIQRNYG